MISVLLNRASVVHQEINPSTTITIEPCTTNFEVDPILIYIAIGNHLENALLCIL